MSILGKIAISLTAKSIQKQLEKAGSKLVRSHVVLKYRHEAGLVDLTENPSFKEKYIHALIGYGIDTKRPETTNLFALDSVSKAYQKASAEGDLSIARTEVEAQSHTSKDKKWVEVKRDFPDWISILPFVEAFEFELKKVIRMTSEPMLLEMFHQQLRDAQTSLGNQETMLANQKKLLKDNEQLKAHQQKDTFEYQIEQYLGGLKYQFLEKYLPEGVNRYVPLIGEERFVQRRETQLKVHIDDRDGKEHLEHEGDEKVEKTREVKKYDLAEDFIFELLEKERDNFGIILGEYGTGKTTLFQKVCHDLAEKYVRNANGEASPVLPLYFPLRDYNGEDIRDFVTTQLHWSKVVKANRGEIDEVLRKGHVAMFFDGFDEMIPRTENKGKEHNLDQIHLLAEQYPDANFYLSCREEYFQSEREFSDLFTGKCDRILHLNTFTEKQIKMFIQQRFDRADWMMQKIKGIYDLPDLAKRAILLDFIVEYLPSIWKEHGEDIDIRSVVLYEKAIETELKGVKKKGLGIPKGGERIAALEHVAEYLYDRDRLEISLRELGVLFQDHDYYRNKSATKIEADLIAFLTFTFLIRERGENYRFSHKSFRDFLVARNRFQMIQSKDASKFGRSKSTDEVNTFLLEMNPNTETLRSFMESSRKPSPEQKFIATNSANLLLMAGKKDFSRLILTECEFYEIDFRSVELVDATLSGALFNSCQFDHSLFDAAAIVNADFEGSSLDLSSTQVSDVSALSELKNLTGLDLRWTQVSDVSALSELKNLTNLDLRSTQVSDVSALSELKNLTGLDLSSTQVSDVSALSELKNLTHLDLRSTQVSDVSALSELKNLTHLYLSSTQVSDVSALSELKNLTHLDLRSTQVSDVSALSELKNLTHLYLSSTQVSDVSALSELKNLTHLDLSSTQVSDVSALSELKNLTHLDLRSTQVSDVSALSELKNLTHLYLSSTQVSDVSALSELKNLTVLDLSSTQVSDVSALSELKNLTVLDLSSRQVSDVSALSELKNLTHLYLSSTQVSDVSALSELKNLTHLYLSSTQVSDVSALSELKNLTVLDLSSTQVSDVSALSGIEDLIILGIK